ncbi:MAG: quinone-dependent dihydroorotate dehydrogenase [Alphaproteobacteria bacterium]|nr:quinone-dependent dihydroorotate dehydrogenase [Alphaproteobacteria bacterium]
MSFAVRLLRALPAETAHHVTVALIERGVLAGVGRRPMADPRLRQRVWGLDFASPIGLAAGFDKDARIPAAMLDIGFAFVEVGSVTPRPQPGNERPRVFRLPRDRAVINRYGFNSLGHAAMRQRLLVSRGAICARGVLGINLGANKDSADPIADYANGVTSLGPLADFLVVNVSSPNTPGLRDLQARDRFVRLVDAVQGARAEVERAGTLPLLFKVAPDLDAESRRDIAEVAVEKKIDGLVVSNTTIARPDTLRGDHRGQAGGLSGAPLFAPSTAMLREIYERTGGAVPLIGVGGIQSGADAYAKIRAGATLVELYTALIYEGPSLIRRMAGDLARLLARDGFNHVAEAVGRDAGRR